MKNNKKAVQGREVRVIEAHVIDKVAVKLQWYQKVLDKLLLRTRKKMYYHRGNMFLDVKGGYLTRGHVLKAAIEVRGEVYPPIDIVIIAPATGNNYLYTTVTPEEFTNIMYAKYLILMGQTVLPSMVPRKKPVPKKAA